MLFHCLIHCKSCQHTLNLTNTTRFIILNLDVIDNFNLGSFLCQNPIIANEKFSDMFLYVNFNVYFSLKVDF